MVGTYVIESDGESRVLTLDQMTDKQLLDLSFTNRAAGAEWLRRGGKTEAKEAKPLDRRVRVIAKPRGGKKVPGAEEFEAETKALRGVRYVRTWAGQERYGIPIGQPIVADVPDDPADTYQAYSPAELNEIYGRQRWSRHIGPDGEGYDVRLMGDGDVILTYPNSTTERDDHIILADGFTEGGMRDLIATIDAAIERSGEVEGWDDDDLAAHLEENGWADHGDKYIDYYETVGESPNKFFGVDRTGDIDFGHITDPMYGPKEAEATFSYNELEELREAFDDAWSAQIMGEGIDDEDDEDDDDLEEEEVEEEDEEDDEEESDFDGILAGWANGDEFVFIEHSGGRPSGSISLTREEANSFVGIMREFEPMDVPSEDEVVSRNAGSWEVDLDNDAQVHVWRLDPTTKSITGVVMSWEEALAAADSFQKLM